jgi:hypothetical protein
MLKFLDYLIGNEPNSRQILINKLQICQELWSNNIVNGANQKRKTQPKLKFYELVQKFHHNSNSHFPDILFQLLYGELMKEDSEIEIDFLAFFQKFSSDLELIHFLD